MGDEPETPKALSQHEPHRSNPEFPHWGRDELDHSHAIFAIAAHLRTLALERWTPRIVRWLSFYDGIERWVDPGQEPCLCVRDLLASYVLCLRSADRPGRADTATSMDVSQLKQSIIDDLLVRYVEALVFQAVAENMASEHAARMVAMKGATDNAGNVIGELKLVYNKTRQAAITKELSEIVSGAAAIGA